MPFGHHHKSQEEVYVLLSGTGRLKLDDEVLELKEWDAVRIPRETMRNLEAGPTGRSCSSSAPRTPAPATPDDARLVERPTSPAASRGRLAHP